LKEKIGILVSFNNFMEEEFIVPLDLGCLASNIRKNICGVFKFIFWKTYEKNMVHYMLSLMLNHLFKNLCLMSSFITKQGKTIVEKHNKKTLYPMFATLV
jgi:hypothetical protein